MRKRQSLPESVAPESLLEPVAPASTNDATAPPVLLVGTGVAAETRGVLLQPEPGYRRSLFGR